MDKDRRCCIFCKKVFKCQGVCSKIDVKNQTIERGTLCDICSGYECCEKNEGGKISER
jgi:hypothetical protein